MPTLTVLYLECNITTCVVLQEKNDLVNIITVIPKVPYMREYRNGGVCNTTYKSDNKAREQRRFQKGLLIFRFTIIEYNIVYVIAK